MDKTDIKNAKRIVERLAYGKNPFTGEKLESDTILNNPELIRCFFLTASVLDDILNKNIIIKKPGKNFTPFNITEEQKKQAVSEEPINITPFVNNIRKVIDNEFMIMPKPVQINDWLADNGYMMRKLDLSTGKTRRLPTEKGESLGIKVVEKDGLYGIYPLCIYSSKAQMFILENMDNILGLTSE